MPLVSIVIPAFNAGRFIGRALNGVLAQTHAEWEVVVVEDGTHDETEAVVREFAGSVSQPVRYENNGVNLGVSVTRNRALGQAAGKVIAFLDADDWWAPEHLAEGLKTLEKGADLCFSGFHLYDESAQKELETFVPDLAELGNPLTRLFRSNFIQTSSLVMVRREAAEKAGGFDVDLKVGEDCDYWMRILACGHKLACTGQATCYYTKHSGSAMAKTLLVAEHSVKFCRKHLHSDFLPRALRKEQYANSLWIYGRLMQRQNPPLARALLLEAWRSKPLDCRYLAHAIRAWGLALLHK